MAPTHSQHRPLVYALGANAVLLLAILVVLLCRGGGPSLQSAAYGANPQPIAGGNGLYLMPGQLQRDRWGCFVMDTNTETLWAYEYFPGTRELQLAAARSFRHDRHLENFNTAPPPQEIEQLLNLQRQGRQAPRGRE